MASYATASNKEPTALFANARTYWKVSAPVVGLVAALGFVLNATNNGALLGEGFLAFDYAHNAVHLLIAGVGLYLGFGGADYALAKGAAKAFGVTYLALAAVGFLSPTVFGIESILGLHFEIGENLIHLALGGWAAYAGFSD